MSNWLHFSKTYPTCFLSEFLLTFEFLLAALLTSLVAITAHGNLSALLLFIPNEPVKSRKRTKTHVKWLYVEPISCYINQKQRGMFIYMETLGIICLMLSSLLLPNTVICQHHFSNLWYNGQSALRFLTGEPPDSGCWSAVKSQHVNPPPSCPNTPSPPSSGEEKNHSLF